MVWFDKFVEALGLFGRAGVVLTMIIFAVSISSVALTARQIRWMFESERIVEETAEPEVVDARGKPQTQWVAGDTLYVRRSLCVFRPVRGVIEQSLIDTAVLSLPEVSADHQLYLDDNAYTEERTLRPAPWCFPERMIPVTTPQFLAPGVVVYRARLDAELNQLKPHVFYSFRPVRFTIIESPMSKEVLSNKMHLEAGLRLLEKRILQMGRVLDIQGERIQEMRGEIRSNSLYLSGLDGYLRSQKILPPPPGPPRK